MPLNALVASRYRRFLAQFSNCQKNNPRRLNISYIKGYLLDNFVWHAVMSRCCTVLALARWRWKQSL